LQNQKEKGSSSFEALIHQGTSSRPGKKNSLRRASKEKKSGNPVRAYSLKKAKIIYPQQPIRGGEA